MTCVLKIKKKARDESLNVEHSNYISKTAFYTATMTDLENRQTTVQIDFLLKYEYTMPTPDLRWILESGDTLINGVACKKATCNYAGRHYIAWYDEKLSCPIRTIHFLWTSRADNENI